MKVWSMYGRVLWLSYKPTNGIHHWYFSILFTLDFWTSDNSVNSCLICLSSNGSNIFSILIATSLLVLSAPARGSYNTNWPTRNGLLISSNSRRQGPNVNQVIYPRAGRDYHTPLVGDNSRLLYHQPASFSLARETCLPVFVTWCWADDIVNLMSTSLICAPILVYMNISFIYPLVGI